MDNQLMERSAARNSTSVLSQRGVRYGAATVTIVTTAPKQCFGHFKCIYLRNFDQICLC